jgi:integrase
MKVSKAAKIWLNYHRIHSKKNTVRCYSAVIGKFCEEFGDRQLNELSVDSTLEFLDQLTNGSKPQTKRIRYAHLSAFFNFIKNNIISDFISPCDSNILRKLYRPKVKTHWDILEKDTVDEIIFRTTKARDRLMLELMARGAMRIGEVLKLTPNDIVERKLLLREPKSGRETEMIFIPQKVADRLKEYVKAQNIGQHDRIFPICYGAARSVVNKAGNLAGILLRPHDLRRHAATFASRSGVPLEIVSKIILRHSNLSTTQIYLGKISDSEALKWIETLYS